LPGATDRSAGYRLADAFAGLPSAAAFLTIVPVPRANGDEGGFAAAPAWFPLIGAGIGAAAGGVRAGTEPAFGVPVATALALAAIVVLTGALHLDGLADAADGLGVRQDRAHRLAVMRDSSTGAFGTLALVLWGLVSFAALESLSSSESLTVLIAAAAAGRWLAVFHGVTLAPARSDGLGSAFHPSRTALAVATVWALAAAIAALGPAHGAVVVGAALVVGGAFTVFARRAFGGRTGDTIGACVVVSEMAAVLAGLALLHG
jgi:adenosylcobinamide-GDP ribazoletransferase